MAGTIGIKIANGDFYPIIEEKSPIKKRVVLTTVHDRQESVQIDLFRSISKSMLDAQYIGSLMVENLQPRPKGAPSIEMVINSDTEGNISADAHDIETGGEHHILNVSLKTLDSIGNDDGFPDFDLGSAEPQTPSGLYTSDEGEREEKRKFPWLIMGIATLFVVIAIALLWFFFLGGRDSFGSGSRSTPQASSPPVSQPERAVPPPAVVQQPQQPQPPAPPPVQQQSQPPAPPPVIQAPVTPPPPRPQTAQRTRPPAPVLSYKVPAVIPRNGVVYQIRWGDTLWDISQAFYRNPWLYPRIARYNNIKNPDLIISGFNIRIPPLNQ